MAANYVDILTLGIDATAAITEYRFVGLAGAHAGYGRAILGSSCFDAAVGERCTVIAQGTAAIEAGGAIASGATVQSDADGKAITLVNGESAGRLAPGASASGAGEIVEVILETKPAQNVQSFTAGEAITLNRFVGTDLLQADAADNAWGVALASAASGATGYVQTSGVATVEAGAAIAAGAAVEADASGKAVTQSAGATLARLLPGESASADGDLVKVNLIPN